MKKRVMSLIAMLITFSAIFLNLPMEAKAQGYHEYYPNIFYANAQSYPYTDGNGLGEGPVFNEISDAAYSNEIGVLNIIEPNAVNYVEIHGSGCEYPVKLTCNGITKDVSYYHDSGPMMGEETLTFNITASTHVTFNTTIHRTDNNHGFRINWIKLYNVTPSPLAAVVDVKPDVLNLRARCRRIKAYIELPEGYDVNNVNVLVVLLNGTVPADLTEPPVVGDYDGDTIPDIMVKFNRTQVTEYILSKSIVFGDVVLNLTGNLYDGTPFTGYDIERVSALVGDVDCNGKVNILDVTKAAGVYGAKEGGPDWNCNANFAKPWDIIDICDLVTIAAHYGEEIP